jgi:membrane peptidoglycan carboxypeptidase
MEELHFAENTPYETIFRPDTNAGEQVMQPEVAAVLKRALIGVVERGTARRVYRAFRRPDGTFIPVGGKTGTGDNRRDVYGSRGRLIKSDVINRTATFVFLIGDRFYGTITAYAAGPDAARYKFTSALPVQLLKVLAPKLMPLLEGTYRITPINLPALASPPSKPKKPKPSVTSGQAGVKPSAKPKPAVTSSEEEVSPRTTESREGTPSEAEQPSRDSETQPAAPPSGTEQPPKDVEPKPEAPPGETEQNQQNPN